MLQPVSTSWQTILSDHIKSDVYRDLILNVERAYKDQDITPLKENIFQAFNLCSFDDIKVVILGQDPYPTPGHAQGLSFSIPAGVSPLAKSLQNIFKEIKEDIGENKLKNGDLRPWVSQGVFLLNSVLTVVEGQPNSHANIGWEKFTDYVLEKISKEKEDVVFLLWGKTAQSKATLIDKKKHLVLEAPHPSPLSAYRGFFGCKHFSKANNYLRSKQIKPINW
jgi:uracil-DNA glycosylase